MEAPLDLRHILPGKVRLQAYLRDLADMFRPWIVALTRLWGFWGPRLTHRQLWVMIIGNAAVLFGFPLDDLAQNKLAMIGWVLANLLSSAMPHDAPDALPPNDFGATGPGAGSTWAPQA